MIIRKERFIMVRIEKGIRLKTIDREVKKGLVSLYLIICFKNNNFKKISPTFKN